MAWGFLPLLQTTFGGLCSRAILVSSMLYILAGLSRISLFVNVNKLYLNLKDLQIPTT